MPYKNTDRAPGRPLKDPKAEAERQKAWRTKQTRKLERRIVAREEAPAPDEIEGRTKRQRRPGKAERRIGFGAHADVHLKQHKPIPVIGARQRPEDRIRRKRLRATPAVN